jgi:hypothetical protein
MSSIALSMRTIERAARRRLRRIPYIGVEGNSDILAARCAAMGIDAFGNNIILKHPAPVAMGQFVVGGRRSHGRGKRLPQADQRPLRGHEVSDRHRFNALE